MSKLQFYVDVVLGENSYPRRSSRTNYFQALVFGPKVLVFVFVLGLQVLVLVTYSRKVLVLKDYRELIYKSLSLSSSFKSLIAPSV